MGRVDGKVALVTGAAVGLGKATARLLAKEGAKVVITTRKKESEGEKVAEDIKRNGGEAVFFKLDVTKEGEWKKVIDKAVKKYGKLNILVNNAGVAIPRSMDEIFLEEWHCQMNTNATGTFLGTKYALEVMKNSGEPCSIVNITSIAALVAFVDFGPYCASKAAVRMYTMATALHCGKASYTIRANSVAPGFHLTNMVEQEAKDMGITIEDYVKEIVKLQPTGHLGEADDVAYAVLYLASDESKNVTGTEIIVDGGYTAQ